MRKTAVHVRDAAYTNGCERPSFVTHSIRIPASAYTSALSWASAVFSAFFFFLPFLGLLSPSFAAFASSFFVPPLFSSQAPPASDNPCPALQFHDTPSLRHHSQIFRRSLPRSFWLSR